MATPFTHKTLTDLEAVKPSDGFEIRIAHDDIDADRTGISHVRLGPGVRQPFGHHHENAEEIYVVIAGAGGMKLDEEIIEIGTLDAIRVAPTVTRSFQAGTEGLEFLAMGTRHVGDGELIPRWWDE
jgi:mannose-6-phosphate isomerase-like protein (cupin superfamily)